MSSAIHKIDHKKWTRLFTHFIVIVMLFVLPEVLLGYSRPAGKPPHFTTWTLYAKSAVYVSVFYINYFFLIRHTLLASPRRIWSFIGWNLAIMIIVVVCLYLFQYYNSPEFHAGAHRSVREAAMHTPPHQPPMEDSDFFNHSRMQLLRSASFWIRDIGMVIMTIALSIVLKLGENWNTIEKRHEQMLATQKTEELSNLKSQLNPHFLFNTLNTIYALIAVSPAQAQQAVHQLSALLRYVLYENPTTVALNKEIEFAKSYISLMEMRLPNGAVEAEFYEHAPTEAHVPPLLFISLIENAFKHGNTGDPTQPISITIASLEDGTVFCKTSNYFILPKNTTNKKEGGIGTPNLRRRLQLIYGDRAKLETTIHGNQYTALLTIKPSTI